jgi:putative Holliday junction resolvase
VEKILGLDLGSRTCGIAMSDALGMIAHGVETFRFQENQYGAAAKRVKEIVEQNNIHTIVLGFPKHMNGDIGERAQISIDFKEKLEKMMDVKVVLVDERLSTVVAENQLIFADVKRKKRKQVIDKMAAVAILQGYLDSH